LVVAVVVDPVTDLGSSKVDRRKEVVAVTGARRLAIAIVVRALIDDAIAVVVEAVTGVYGAGIDVGVQGVTVAIAGGETVTVEVQILINLGVTIVVDAITQLRGARKQVRVLIVTVHRAKLSQAAWMRARDAVTVQIKALVRQPIAVVVDPVTGFLHARIDGEVVVIAVLATLTPTISITVGKLEAYPVIDEAIAVGVFAIAEFDGVGKDSAVFVVAVSRDVTDTIVVAVVVETIIDQPVAVCVAAITCLIGTRIDDRELVVAVELVFWVVEDALGYQAVEEAVLVHVVGLVNAPVTVIVYGVAGLRRAGVGVGVRIVAVSSVQAAIGALVFRAEAVAVQVIEINGWTGVIIVSAWGADFTARSQEHTKEQGEQEEMASHGGGPLGFVQQWRSLSPSRLAL